MKMAVYLCALLLPLGSCPSIWTSFGSLHAFFIVYLHLVSLVLASVSKYGLITASYSDNNILKLYLNYIAINKTRCTSYFLPKLSDHEYPNW